MTDHMLIIRLHAGTVNRNGSSEPGFTRKDHERLTVATIDELARNDSNPPSVNIPACQKETGTLTDAFPNFLLIVAKTEFAIQRWKMLGQTDNYAIQQAQIGLNLTPS